MAVRASQHDWSSALPAYMGGKRLLAPLIFAELATVVPSDTWSHLALVDPFSGGGSVALHAKALGFSVVAGDVSALAVTVGLALVANSSVKLTAADLRGLFVAAESHVSDATEPRALTANERQWIAGALEFAEAHDEPRRSLLRLLVIRAALRLRPMSVLHATDAHYFESGDFDRLTPKRLAHYLRAGRAFELSGLRKNAAAINQAVFAGHGRAVHGDALRTLRETCADIAFLDPPYPKVTGYVSAYQPLLTMLGEPVPLGATVPSLDEILGAASAIPTVVLTYGGRGVTLDSLVEQVGRHRSVVRAVAIPYPHLPALARKERARANREHVIVAVR